MAFAYLIDPENQFMTKWGTINVDGFLRVFDAATDDPIVTYSDFHGTANPERIALDNNGRAVVIADSDRAYRLEVYDRYGSLMWTTSPLWCQASGGGVPGTDVISSDGSVSVDKITVGSMTTFDLSAHVEDSTDLLNWIRCDGGINIAGTDIWKPTYSAGSMVVGNRGVRLDADQYYHVTARVRAQKSGAAAYYDDLQLILKTDDGTTVSEVARKGVVVDASMGLYQDFEISADVLAGSDCELLLEITGKELDVINFQVLDMEVHRVYSGAPHLPPGTLRAEQADWTETDDTKSSFIRHKPDLSLYVTDSELDTILEGYAITQAMDTALAGKQNVLTAGSNIVIENDVISATAEPQLQANWDEGDSSSVQYIQNKPDLSVYATTQAMDTALAGKQDTLTAGSNITIDANNVISASAAPQQQANWNESDTSSVQYIQNKPDLSVYATTQAMNTALAGKQDTISDLDAIRSGAQAGSTAVQPAALADYQEKLTAGSNISISANNEISATDTTYSAGTGLDLTGTTFSVDTTTIATKSDLPIQQQLVPGYSLPEDAGKVLMAGSTTYWSSLSDYVTDTELSTILQGYQEALTAGSNITISNGTISATDTTYTAGNGLSLNGTEFSVDTSVVQPKLTAGSNISISGNNEISATDTTYSAGSGLDLTGTTFSVDTSTIATKTDLAAYTPTASLGAVALSNDYDDLSNKPTIPVVPDMKNLVAGNNVSITEDATTVTISASGAPQLQANWNEQDSSSVQYIQNKPTIPVLPSTKDLVAGSNITITESSNDVTVACSITVGTVTV